MTTSDLIGFITAAAILFAMTMIALMYFFPCMFFGHDKRVAFRRLIKRTLWITRCDRCKKILSREEK